MPTLQPAGEMAQRLGAWTPKTGCYPPLTGLLAAPLLSFPRQGL